MEIVSSLRLSQEVKYPLIVCNLLRNASARPVFAPLFFLAREGKNIRYLYFDRIAADETKKNLCCTFLKVKT